MVGWLVGAGRVGSPELGSGELPLGVPQNLVPFITQSAAGLRGALKVFGNDYPTKDGTCVRDYIHVVDVAKAHILGMDRLVALLVAWMWTGSPYPGTTYFGYRSRKQT